MYWAYIHCILAQNVRDAIIPSQDHRNNASVNESTMAPPWNRRKWGGAYESFPLVIYQKNNRLLERFKRPSQWCHIYHCLTPAISFNRGAKQWYIFIILPLLKMANIDCGVSHHSGGIIQCNWTNYAIKGKCNSLCKNYWSFIVILLIKSVAQLTIVTHFFAHRPILYFLPWMKVAIFTLLLRIC